MDARGLAARAHDLPTWPRRAVIALMMLLVVLVSLWSLTITTADLPIALWWPAAAFGVFAVLISRGRRIAVTVVLTILVVLCNETLPDRPLGLSIAYGFANAMEYWVVVRMLTGGRAHARFRTLPHIGWFLISASTGAFVIGVIGATAAALAFGVDPLLTFFSLFTSHASAMYALVPIALVALTVRLRVPVVEVVAQSIALAALTAIVFAPADALPLTFLIVTTLMWGGYRMPPLVPALQTLLLAGAATWATALGIGPFALLIDDDLRGAIFALQLFIMTHAAAGLFVSGQSHDWYATADALAKREREATRVAEQLRELNVQKDDFISSVSHELRTPVTSIIGFSEELVDAQLDGPTAQAATIVNRNARRLADVIEDVLEFSRISATQTTTRLAVDLDLRDLLNHAVEDATGLVPNDKQIHIALSTPDREVPIRVVEQDLVRVYTNLLSNAVKFSPDNATVRVSLDQTPDDVIVTISDEGPGIPLAEQEAVWQRFYRVQSPRHSEVPGTGLGLPIVKALIENRLGGDVTLESDGEHGTTVRVRTPRQPPSRPTPVVGSSFDQRGGS